MPIPTRHLSLTLVALAALLGACAVDDAGQSGNNGDDDAGRPDLPSMIDTGHPDAEEDGTSQPDGSLDSNWDPSALELRTREEVCGRWIADRSLREPNAWTSGGGGCSPGTLKAEAIEDAVRYTNLYRWLVGLPGIEDDAGLNAKAQACAVIMRALGDIEHVVPDTVDCWTAEGSEAAQSSNLALGPRHPAPAVDLYMVDSDVESLGHRRWLINPSYGEGGFGLADRYSCQWVFSFTGQGQADFMAFPNPGYAPLTERPIWSISFGDSAGFDGSTGVKVFDVETGEEMTVSSYLPDRGYGPDTIAFTPEGWVFEHTYEVRVLNALIDGEHQDIIYRTTPTLCQ